MKKTILLFLLFVAIASQAQVGINPTGASPHPSAMLDVSANNKGFLPPRMTSAERIALPTLTPANGLIVFDTDTQSLWIIQSGVWVNLSLVISSGSGPWLVSGNNINNTNTSNVGIGTTIPSAKLDVNGNVVIAGSIKKVQDIEASSDINTATNLGVGGLIVPNSGVGQQDQLLENNGNGTMSWKFKTWQNLNTDIINYNNGKVGIGPTIFIPKAKFEANSAASVNTNALFGSNGTGISLQKNWPTIGFNTYRDDANLQKYIGDGFGFGISVNQTNGTMFWNKMGSGNTDGQVGLDEELVMSLTQGGKLNVINNIEVGPLSVAGSFANAIGYQVQATQIGATAMGYATAALGKYSTALGNSSGALDDYSVAIGRNCTASKFHAIAIGQNAEAQEFASVAIGPFVKATKTYSTAIGFGSEANGNNSTAIGNGVVSSAYGSLAVGSYNKLNANGLFMVGNGIDNANRKTSFIIRKDNNRVGIGTENPEAPLHVVGNASVLQSFAFYAANGLAQPITGTVLLADIDISILASNRVVASEFNAFSDARHKNIKARNDNKIALSNILKLTPTQYQFVDTATKGAKEKLGFIAQEVEKVLPLAVSTTSEYIPNVYALASSFNYDFNAKTLSIKLEKAHDFKLGDEIKIVTSTSEFGKVTQIIDDNTFIINNIQNKPEGVFVFGKKVNDFRVVDYDHIFTLGISAIQQLAKENEILKNKIATFESRLESIEASLKNNFNLTTNNK
jgi:hypothetical protein